MKLLVLGAGGQIARWVIGMLANNDDLKLTLFLRHPKKFKNAPKRSQVVQGDVLDKKQLGSVVAGQDIVYANLTGEDIDSQAKAIVEAMGAAKVKRLIFVASLGIYDEVPGKFGEWNRRERLSSAVSQGGRFHRGIGTRLHDTAPRVAHRQGRSGLRNNREE